MQFNSFVFLVFFPFVAALCAIFSPACMKKAAPEKLLRIRHIILLLASYVFYGWWNWKFCFLMLLMTTVAYVSALHYSRHGKKFAVYIGVIFPLLVLGVFKYFNFFVGSFCDAFGIVNPGTLRIILPVGISFYTFQSLSYTIDVYRGKLPAEGDFVKLAMYIAFFPQLVAGPIVKAEDFIPQLYEDRNINIKNIEIGLQIFAFGLFKKIVMADNIAVFVDAVHAAPEAYSGATLLLSAFAHYVQIYCDFSGYSDMAVGCAKALGYELTRNFNLPFVSENITGLWKRWHISLSTWLHEYLYISLGGSRKGNFRTYVNLMVTMVLGGLWHGAAWTFVLWGALIGLAQVAERFFNRNFRKKPKGPKKTITRIGGMLLTTTFFSFMALLFRAESVGTAWKMFMDIITWQPGLTHIGFWPVVSIVLVLGCCIVAALRSKKLGLKAIEGFYPIFDLNTIKGLVIFFTFVGLTLGLAYTGESPFIYFQF